LKKIEDYIRTWRELPSSWIVRANTVKMAILLIAIHRVNAHQNLSVIFSKLKKSILKFMANIKGPKHYSNPQQKEQC
jgi:hypothetical protein